MMKTITRKFTSYRVVVLIILFFIIFSAARPIPRTEASPLYSSTYTNTFPVRDAAYTESNYPNTPTGGQQNYYLGEDLLNGDYNKGHTRLYLRFNFGVTSLPTGSTITNARIYLYQYSRSCALNSTFSYTVYPVTSSWTGTTMTWNSSPTLGTSIGTGSFTCISSQWKTINITSLAQSWYEGNANRGISIRGNPETAAGVVFRSHTCDTSQCPGQEHPYLSVEYTVSNPIPTITGIDPSSIPAGNAGFTLTVNGTDFVSGALVQWNGMSRPTNFINSTQLTAAIDHTDIISPGNVNITVLNPTPGGGLSNTKSLTITAKPWTFLLYLAGDDDELNLWMELAIKTLEQEPPNPNINVVVLLDDSGPDDSKMFLIQPDGQYTLGVNKWYIEEVNTGDPLDLSTFIKWAKGKYPAQNYYLAIAGHGRGTQGIAWDKNSEYDYLTTSELRTALDQATNGGEWKIDVLHFDACLMGMLEDAYQIQDYADYMVASENLGWSLFPFASYSSNGSAGTSVVNSPYTFTAVASQVTSSTTPQQLAINITDAYFNHPGLQNYPRTIAALDLSKSNGVRQAVDTLADSLRANLTSIKIEVGDARFDTQKFDSRDYYHITQNDEYVDLYDLAKNLKQSVTNSSVQVSAQGVMDAITNGFVIAEHHQSGATIYYPGEVLNLDNAHGVSIYFPPRSGSKDYTSYLSNGLFQFTIDSHWDEFLYEYIGLIGLPPDPGDEPIFPPMPSPYFVIYLPIIIH
jgi:hypothetical protein